ncbi:hypothetical protein BpHYR1_032955 [Brachionus plicatilis]|uniref:Uncharacterized protein n=1 Tax=Brachionus plicatilis TaxID=10195 RepID=A0A3M7QSM0_BRAPC|nr:hypothetical protein BpHYR1_032955 [Brachionus plicatilis]
MDFKKKAIQRKDSKDGYFPKRDLKNGNFRGIHSYEITLKKSLLDRAFKRVITRTEPKIRSKDGYFRINNVLEIPLKMSIARKDFKKGIFNKPIFDIKERTTNKAVKRKDNKKKI